MLILLKHICAHTLTLCWDLSVWSFIHYSTRPLGLHGLQRGTLILKCQHIFIYASSWWSKNCETAICGFIEGVMWGTISWPGAVISFVMVAVQLHCNIRRKFLRLLYAMKSQSPIRPYFRKTLYGCERRETNYYSLYLFELSWSTHLLSVSLRVIFSKTRQSQFVIKLMKYK